MSSDSLEAFAAEAQSFLDAHARLVDRSIGVWGEGSDAVGAYQGAAAFVRVRLDAVAPDSVRDAWHEAQHGL